MRPDIGTRAEVSIQGITSRRRRAGTAAAARAAPPEDSEGCAGQKGEAAAARAVLAGAAHRECFCDCWHSPLAAKSCSFKGTRRKSRRRRVPSVLFVVGHTRLLSRGVGSVCAGLGHKMTDNTQPKSIDPIKCKCMRFSSSFLVVFVAAETRGGPFSFPWLDHVGFPLSPLLLRALAGPC